MWTTRDSLSPFPHSRREGEARASGPPTAHERDGNERNEPRETSSGFFGYRLIILPVQVGTPVKRRV